MKRSLVWGLVLLSVSIGLMAAKHMQDITEAPDMQFIAHKNLELLADVYLVKYDSVDLYVLRIPGRDGYPKIRAFESGQQDRRLYQGKIDKIIKKGTSFKIDSVEKTEPSGNEVSFFVFTNLSNSQGKKVRVMVDCVLRNTLEDESQWNNSFFALEKMVRIKDAAA